MPEMQGAPVQRRRSPSIVPLRIRTMAERRI
jgi:hypothetical protein